MDLPIRDDVPVSIHQSIAVGAGLRKLATSGNLPQIHGHRAGGAANGQESALLIDGKEYQTLVKVDVLTGKECGFFWKSLSGPKHWGTIQLEAQVRGVTLIEVEMEYLPETGSPTALALEEKVEGDLRAFKRFVEGQQKKEPVEQSAFEVSNASEAIR